MIELTTAFQLPKDVFPGCGTDAAAAAMLTSKKPLSTKMVLLPERSSTTAMAETHNGTRTEVRIWSSFATKAVRMTEGQRRRRRRGASAQGPPSMNKSASGIILPGACVIINGTMTKLPCAARANCPLSTTKTGPGSSPIIESKPSGMTTIFPVPDVRVTHFLEITTTGDGRGNGLGTDHMTLTSQTDSFCHAR